VPEDDYTNSNWDDLTPQAQAAAETLGYNQAMWDNGVESETSDEWWQCLTQSQQKAAAFLGYDKEEWNGSDAPAEIKCDDATEEVTTALPPTPPKTTVTEPVPEDDYTNSNWDDLTPQAQAAAETLGYNQAMWDNAVESDTGDKWWQCLTQSQQDAAAFLGFNKEEWNGSDVPDDVECEEEDDGEDAREQFTYYDKDWDELPENAKDAARFLGYNKALWDSGTTPEEVDEWWSDLTREQREKAALLGYNEKTWNGEDRRHLAEQASDDVALKAPFEGEDKLYKTLYICASLGFVFVGLLYWVQIRKLYPLMFVVAGMFGFVSALYVLDNARLSNILSAVSIHFYFIEACAMAWNRLRKREKEDSFALKVADTAFGIGATMELVLSYFYIFDPMADFNMGAAGSEAAAQSLWVVCALIYLSFTLTNA